VVVNGIAATFAVSVEVVVAAAVAAVVRFPVAAIVAVVDEKATSAFPDKSIQKLFAKEKQIRQSLIKVSKSYSHQYKLQEALAPELWHGTQLGESFGWQEGAAGAASSRGKE
jgi:hypothetical protein